MPLTSGTRLGPYEILSALGAGGMGEVYLARDTRLERKVAIKVLRADKVADSERKRRFIHEARAASALSHPNIVVLYDIATDRGIDYIVMEYLPGKPLDRLGDSKPASLMQATGYVAQLASALAAAYAVGVVHRDIKPGNIMVMANSRVKLLDFGLSKLTDGPASSEDETRTALTIENAIIGTVAYMSPEQAGGRFIDHRSDIFSLGVVLYELISGKRPFRGSSPIETMHAIIHEPYPPAEIGTPELAEILAKALAKDPADRYQHAGDFALDLRRLQHTFERGTLPSSSPSSHPATQRPRILLWSAVVLLLLVIAASWFVLRRQRTPVNPLEGAAFTRLTDFPGSELAAEISFDGKFVAFISDRDGPFDLFLTQVGSGRFQNLTHNKQSELLELTRSTGFSGDGSEVWYRFGPVAGNRMIGVVPIFGGERRPLVQGVSVAWSPDGSRIVYHKGVPPGDPMFVADHTGANARQIFIDPKPGGHCHFPVWSQDGKWIYFVRGNLATLEMDVWRISPEGGQPEQLTHLSTDINYLAPLDGHTLLFTATDGDGSGPWLWALDLADKSSRRVSFGLERYLSVSASLDGTRVVATVSNPSASLWSLPILDRPADEHDAKLYPLPTVRALAPRFGGGSLFYLSALGGGDGLWRYRDNQAMEIWKGANGVLLKPAAISADGKRVAISLRREGKITLNVMSDDGLNITPLAERIDVRGTASWSPDGRWIVTGGQDAHGPGLFKIPVDGGDPVRLVNTAAFNPVWSPDGNLIVYCGAVVGRAQPLRSVRPDGTGVELPNIDVRDDGVRYRFLPSGKGLVYMDGLNRRLDFALLDLGTLKTRQLSQLKDPSAMKTFDIAPDGKTIVFDRIRENSDVVLIDLPAKHPK